LLLCATALFLQLLFLAPKGGSFFVAAQQPSPAVSANATAVVDFLQLTNMVRYTTGWRRRHHGWAYI